MQNQFALPRGPVLVLTSGLFKPLWDLFLCGGFLKLGSWFSTSPTSDPMSEVEPDFDFRSLLEFCLDPARLFAWEPGLDVLGVFLGWNTKLSLKKRTENLIILTSLLFCLERTSGLTFLTSPDELFLDKEPVFVLPDIIESPSSESSRGNLAATDASSA